MLALSGCAMLRDAPEESGAVSPSTSTTPASAGAATPSAAAGQAGGSLFYMESITGGAVGNRIFGTGELRDIAIGDTEGLVQVTDFRFRRPVAVAARDHDLYVVDADREEVLLYDRFSARVQSVLQLRGLVAGDVADIYVGPDRSIYLADTLGSRVLQFNRNGKLVRTYEDRLNLARPVAVSVDENTGDVYVADGVLDHVVVFNRAGKLWRALGSRGEGDGEFLNITSMARGPDGVYVVARLGHRGQVLADNGAHAYNLEANAIVFPNSVAVDVTNHVYVTDFFDNAIKVFKQGKLVATVGGTGSGPGRFKGISDVWLESGFLYVADSLNGRVQVFRLTAAGQ